MKRTHGSSDLFGNPDSDGNGEPLVSFWPRLGLMKLRREERENNEKRWTVVTKVHCSR